jgi:hypothetical protein
MTSAQNFTPTSCHSASKHMQHTDTCDTALAAVCPLFTAQQPTSLADHQCQQEEGAAASACCCLQLGPVCLLLRLGGAGADQQQCATHLSCSSSHHFQSSA